MCPPHASEPQQAPLPIIDLSDGARAAALMRDAAASHGFFYIVNHGVDSTLVQRQFEQSRAFFALPEAEKNKVEANEQARGYTSSTYQTVDPKSTVPDALEGFWAWIPEVQPGEPGSELPYKGLNIWPDADLVPGFRETLTEYMVATEKLSRRVIKLVAQALDLPEDYFEPFFRHAQNQLRTMHYLKGKSEPENGKFGAGQHTDWGFITFLVDDGTPGLQLNYTGEWEDVKPVPNSFIVNFGDMLNEWSNGKFKSTKHRVVKPEKERYSCALFVAPSPDARIECLPTCVNGGAKYEPLLASQYLESKYKQLADSKKALADGTLKPI
ncbi:hypothetical protein WJX73_003556 [Symbiochloris irregularis]|uniref:Fe2OG dioxygenase domain-containing protein n=1 Tax=Symbiochloris irregularis TaxID=706552 RepID=A0AAW1PMH1_9CHLO